MRPAAAVVRAEGLRFEHRSVRARGRGAGPGCVGVEALSAVVEAGEVVGVLGPNGAGKSTLLRMLGTLLRPQAGTLLLFGEDATRPAPRLRRRVGFAADTSAHIEALTGFENALWFARAAGVPGDEAGRRVAALFDRLGLDEFAGVRCREYSHGTRRKLLLVAALAHEPGLIVLDEPTLGLDPKAADALVTLLRDRAEAGAAVILATHDLHAAHRLCHRVIFLDHGRVVLDGAPATLLASAGAGRTRIRVTFRAGNDPLLRTPGVELLRCEPGALELLCDSGGAALPALCADLIAQSLDIASIELREPDLRDVFSAATGRAWQPGPAPS
jgi:ABC-type multidrug transport system ATPase subunit